MPGQCTWRLGGGSRGRGEGGGFLRLESRAHRQHEDLIRGSGVEPEAADGEAPPARLDERAALKVALAAVRARALPDDARAQPFDRAKAELAPRVQVAAFMVAVVANLFAFDEEIESPRRDARFDG